MPDQETWKFINSFAPWLAALGTIAAVITSLYLARKDARVDLEVRALIRVLVVEGDDPGPRPEFVSVEVANIGRRVATVTHVYWKTGIFRKTTYIWIVPRNRFSSQIPIKMNDGDQASFMGPLVELESKIVESLAKDVSGWAAPIKAAFVRIGVITSTGDHFESRVDKSLRERLVKLADKS